LCEAGIGKLRQKKGREKPEKGGESEGGRERE